MCVQQVKRTFLRLENWLLGIVLLFVLVQNFYTYAVPASWWFEVFNVHVEDHPEGVMPTVHYSRRVNRKFYGSYATYIYDASDPARPLCNAGDSWHYKPRDPSGPLAYPGGVTLKWYMAETDCTSVLKAAHRYILSTTWIVPNGKEVTFVTEPWRVCEGACDFHDVIGMGAFGLPQKGE